MLGAGELQIKFKKILIHAIPIFIKAVISKYYRLLQVNEALKCHGIVPEW